MSKPMMAKDAKPAESRTLSGAEIVIEALREQGVEVMFGYPGGAVLPIYDALHEDTGPGAIRHVLVRHEQGA
ncbi:MAG: thiamine pyrophosphate-binding protein, partial [Pseudomonadota bacterium]